jgi:Transcriptional regulators
MEQSDKEALIQAFHKLRRPQTWRPMMTQISRGEFFMLHIISHRSREASPEKPGAKITDLSIAAEMSKPAVSQMLNSLEDKGMIERIMTKNDRRVVYVCLTEKGKQQLALAAREMEDLMEEVVRELGPEDTAELVRLLGKLHAVMEKRDNHS